MPNDDYMDPLVEQLHACLAEALRQGREEPFASPVSVAEIYQDLVPYRSVRSRLGFEMNADYEHTLLRLLAGEGGYARLDPKEARDELKAELDMPNPNVGLFRKFAGCDVWISSPREGVRLEPVRSPAPAAAAILDPEPTASVWPNAPVAEPAWNDTEDAPELLLDEEVDETDIVDEVLFEVPSEPVASASPRAQVPVRAAHAEPIRAPQSAPAEPARATQPPPKQPTPVEERAVSTTLDTTNGRAASTGKGHCAFCDGALPSTRAVKFCPFCGMDQSMHPCSACGEALEPEWRFCIACGSQSAVAATAS